MTLTRSFKKTVQARAQKDPAFRAALLAEGETELKTKLLEGLSGGEGAFSAADWDEIRKEAMAKIASRKSYIT